MLSIREISGKSLSQFFTNKILSTMKKALAFLPVLLLLTAAMTMSFSPENTGSGYKIGDTAQDFNLKNVNGKKVSLAGIKNAKGYIVIFTCNHCPYAIAYEQRIIELHQKYAPLGFSVIAINPNDKDVQIGRASCRERV